MTDTANNKILLISSAIVLLCGDAAQVTNHDNILWTILLALSFLLFIAGMPAINALLQGTNKKFVFIIHAFLLIGALAGASMQVLFRAMIVLRQANLTEAAGALSNHQALALTTMVPGIFFPFGLILLSIALFLSRKYATWKVALLLMGGILFPVGHALGHPIALIAGDLVLIGAWFVLSAEIPPPVKNVII